MNIRKIMLLASVSRFAANGFDTGQPGWKMDGDHVVLNNGHPTFVTADGKEMTVDGTTISRLNGEAASHRQKYEEAAKLLDAYKVDGKPLDPVAAKEAFAKLKDVDLSQMVQKGELDKVREEVAKSYAPQIQERDKAIGDLSGTNDALRRDLAFATSAFMENVAVPPEMFRAYFSNNFKTEDGKLVPYDAHGNKMYSTKRSGEIATFDEALEMLVAGSPHKDQILKAPGHGGSGGGGNGGGRGGGRTVRRSDFDAMNPMEKAQTAAAMGKGELTIVD